MNQINKTSANFLSLSPDRSEESVQYLMGKIAYDYRIRPKLHREGRPNLQNCTGTGTIYASGLVKPGGRLQER